MVHHPSASPNHQKYLGSDLFHCSVCNVHSILVYQNLCLYQNLSTRSLTCVCHLSHSQQNLPSPNRIEGYGSTFNLSESVIKVSLRHKHSLGIASKGYILSRKIQHLSYALKCKRAIASKSLLGSISL